MKKTMCGIIALALILTMLFTGGYHVEAASTPELSKKSITLVKGNAATLNILDVSSEEKESAEWGSTNSKVVSVTQKGRIKANMVGEATIVVTVSGTKLFCKVTVESLITNYTNKVVNLVNEERTEFGVGKLKTDATLTKAAQARARELAEGSYVEHSRPNGDSYLTVFSEYKIKYCGAMENLARGQETPVDVMKSWMGNSGNKASILNSDYTHIGVGYYDGYWVQLFIKKK